MSTNHDLLQKPVRQNEDLLKATVGDFGRWQFKIAFLMALLKFPIAWFQLSIVFIAPPTEFWCRDPLINHTEDGLKMYAGENGNIPTLRYEGLNKGYCDILDSNSSKSIPCPNGYEYNRTIFKSTIISEWDLVCGRQTYMDISQVTLMFGVLVGNIWFGILADRKGRKCILISCIILQTIFGIVLAWVPWFWAFIAIRFLLGIANGGTMVTSFVMCMETVGGKWRTIVPILYQIPFGFGNSIMAGLAYVLRDWRYFQMAISGLSAVYISYVWFIPESPRWLLAVGRSDEAMGILKSAASCNRKDPEKVNEAMTDLSNISVDKNKSSFGALFSTPELKKRTSLLCLNWTIAGITFYAFSQYLGHVSKNLFFTVAAGGLIALPGTLFCIYVTSHFGRRYTIAASNLMTAICFFAILAVPKGMFVHDWPRIAFAGLGIVGLSIAFPASIFSPENYFPRSCETQEWGHL